MRRRQLARRLCLTTMAIALAACSEESPMDSGDDGTGGTGSATDFYGFFLDDAVKGLQYRAGDGPLGTTDEHGTFQSRVGDAMTFFVDGVEIGTASEGRTRLTPADFGATGANVARFLQSLDTSPGAGIDLSGVNLASTPINFNQSRDAFAADAAVQQAIADAAAAGAQGALVSESEALGRLAMGTSSVFEAADFENMTVYPVTPGPNNEPCLVRFRADRTGQNICQDDIDADPRGAAEEFSWSIDDVVAVAEFDFGAGVEERVTLQRLGTTGNRISVQLTTECLTCDPNVEPAIEGGVQTLITALPLAEVDFAGQGIAMNGPNQMKSVSYAGGGIGTYSDGAGSRTFQWSVGASFRYTILMRGTGDPGSVLPYHEAVLVDGTPLNGTYAILLASAVDTNQNGVIDDEEAASTIEYAGIELWTATPLRAAARSAE